jgi:hypothetical protein
MEHGDMGKSDQLKKLVDHCLDAEDRGEKISLTQVCHQWPELRPELEGELDAHRRAVMREQELGLGQNEFGSLRLEPGAEPKKGYRLVKPLGRGGFGEVWEAKKVSGIFVALKFISLHRPAGEKELAALERVKNLRHRNLLTIHDYWVDDSTLVIETELGDGSLQQRWQECLDKDMPGIPAQELIGYLVDIADALDFLHSQKPPLAHCDIKPENILLKGGKALLADPGTILVIGDPDELAGWCTKEFAAPEILQAVLKSKTDPNAMRGIFNAKTDQYALAVTLRKLLRGNCPNEVKKALAEQPENRYPDCASFMNVVKVSVNTSDAVPRVVRIVFKMTLVGVFATLLTFAGYVAVTLFIDGEDFMNDSIDFFFRPSASLWMWTIPGSFLLLVCYRKTYRLSLLLLWLVGMVSLIGVRWRYSYNQQTSESVDFWLIGIGYTGVFVGLYRLMDKWLKKPWNDHLAFDED